MRRRRCGVLILIAWAGCQGGPGDAPLPGKLPPLPAPPLPAADSKRASPVHVTIWEWRARSRGAGIDRTSLWVCQVDFLRSRGRSKTVVARRPQPLIAAPHNSHPELPLEDAWQPVPAADMQRIRAAIDAWLATSPPPVCEFYRPGGREDGYAMRFSLQTEETTYHVRANPDRPRGEIAECDPDPTFQALVQALVRQADWSQPGTRIGRHAFDWAKHPPVCRVTSGPLVPTPRH